MEKKILALCLSLLLLAAGCTPPQPTEGGLDTTTAHTPPPTTEPRPWPSDAALTRFLSEVNHSGTIAPGGLDDLPGSRPEPWQIPQPDQSLVGQTVEIVLAWEQQAIPFYYLYDKDSGLERLAVIISANRIPLLMVFETGLKGSGGLWQQIALQQPFAAKILSMTNIAYEEWIYSGNACEMTADIPGWEVLANRTGEQLTLSTKVDQARECLGVVGTIYDGSVMVLLKGSPNDTQSDAMLNDLRVFQRILKRFSLWELFEG